MDNMTRCEQETQYIRDSQWFIEDTPEFGSGLKGFQVIRVYLLYYILK